jgi:hypothetical protein
MHSDIDSVMGNQLVRIEDISEVKDTIKDTKEKTMKTQFLLMEMKKNFQNPFECFVKSS